MRSRATWLFLTAWLVACAGLLLLSRSAIERSLFPDPDDTLRLLQVRDWLAGQSWFDVTQYRMNPPDGVPMHWSRLVDLPIAAVILLFRPLLGQANSELAALILVPLLTLGVVMALVGSLSRRLLSPRLALLAMVVTPVSIGALTQMRPMRIDHHGWQIALALVAVLATMDERPRRSALIAGGAAALWLNISVEGLPLAAALGALFALRWLADPAAFERLRTYVAALAGGSLLFFLLARAPADWADRACDAVSPAHLATFGIAALCCLAAVRPGVAHLWARLAVLGASGALALATMLAIDGQCARDPFASLDPQVRAFWYERVLEGLPIWRQDFITAITFMALPIVGLAGGFLAWRSAEPTHRGRWESYLFLLAAATVASLLVLRSGGFANILALPGAAFLCGIAVERARALSLTPVRVLATAAAFFTVMPAYAIALVAGRSNTTNTTSAARLSTARTCMSAAEMGRLSQLPTGDVAAPLDIGPAIIVHTPHRVIASGHHRNVSGMRDVIRLFTLPPETAREIIARRDIEYIVVCPSLLEPNHYAADNRAGLWSNLAADRAPPWLEAVRVQGTQALRVWRVRKGLLGTGA